MSIKHTLSRFNKVIFIGLGLVCLLPMVDAALALVMGIAWALMMGNPFQDVAQKHTTTLLSFSIIGLGAAMNLDTVVTAGMQGFGFTALGIVFTFCVGIMFIRLLKLNREMGFLITVGTAICGGSAIAAIVPIMNAKPQNVSVALAIVFVLNALALLIFPYIGEYLGLSQHQFGVWSALAIHDTSSVVGATLQYGPEALEVGTTTKLTRALWIIPLMIATQIFYRTEEPGNVKKKRPWFILGFIVMAAAVTYIPTLQEPGEWIAAIAKQLLVLTLFLIGANLSVESLKEVGAKPLLYGAVLWAIVATVSVIIIQSGVIGL